MTETLHSRLFAPLCPQLTPALIPAKDLLKERLAPERRVVQLFAKTKLAMASALQPANTVNNATNAFSRMLYYLEERLEEEDRTEFAFATCEAQHAALLEHLLQADIGSSGRGNFAKPMNNALEWTLKRADWSHIRTYLH